jgi:hypothetical protein
MTLQGFDYHEVKVKVSTQKIVAYRCGGSIGFSPISRLTMTKSAGLVFLT